MSSAFLKPILLLTAISFGQATLTDADFDQIASNLGKALSVDRRPYQFDLLCNPSNYPTETAILVQNLSASLVTLLPSLTTAICQNANIKAIASKLLYLSPETVVRYALCSLPAASTITTRCRPVSWNDTAAVKLRDTLALKISECNPAADYNYWVTACKDHAISPYAVCTNQLPGNYQLQFMMSTVGSSGDQLMAEYIFSPPCTQATASRSQIADTTQFLYAYVCTLPTANNSLICQPILKAKVSSAQVTSLITAAANAVPGFTGTTACTGGAAQLATKILTAFGPTLGTTPNIVSLVNNAATQLCGDTILQASITSLCDFFTKVVCSMALCTLPLC